MSLAYSNPIQSQRARDDDNSLVALFKLLPVKNDLKSMAEGRVIYDDIEVCEIRFPGKTDIRVSPAHAFSHWVTDEYGQRQITYAERFRKQYQQFKEHAAQTLSGTPLDKVPWLSPARVAELQAVHVYTAETLAGMDGPALKTLGIGGREMKDRATAWIAEAKANAPTAQMLGELELLKQQKQLLEEDNRILRQRGEVENGKIDSQFENMSDEQLKDYIAAQSGQKVLGNLGRKNLLRMAMDHRPKNV
jgi:hypothetical protein